jgi:uncharacterized protein YjcR
MGKRSELEPRAIDLYAGGMEIPQISVELEVSENSLREWKKRAGTEWDDARAAFRRGLTASFEDVGARVARAREITRRMTGDAASQSAMGQILNESVQAMVYDIMGQIQTCITDPEEMSDVIKKVNGIALILARTEQAASVNLKREKEIRKQALSDAADAVEKAAVQQGMNAEQASFWRQQVLGVQ